MRQCSRSTAWAAAVLATLLHIHDLNQPAAAQVLDLDSSASAQSLAESPYWGELAALVEREVATLDEQRKQAQGQATFVIEARRNYRRLAVDCLTRGKLLGHRGSLAIMTGYRLTASRAELDQVLNQWLGQIGDAAAAADVGPSLRLFNERLDSLLATWRDKDDGDAAAHDQMLAAIMAPLADAVGAIGGVAPRSQWLEPIDANAAEPDKGGSPSTRLRASLAELQLRPPTQQVLREIVDALERGAAFPEHRPLAATYQLAIEQAILFATELRAAAWMDAAHREVYADRLHEAVILFKDKATRAKGLLRLERLDRSRQLLNRLTTLAASGLDLKALIPGAMAADDAAHHDGATGDERKPLTMPLAVLDRMVAFRALPPAHWPNEEFHRVERLLERAYQSTETALLARFEMLATQPGALADPAIASLLADHANGLDDLRLAREIDGWIQAVAALRPASAEPFTAQTLKMLRWLLNPAHRPDAVLAMSQFNQQLRMFRSLPFEDELRRNDPAAIAFTGGRQAKLAARIDAARDGWAKGWGEGKAAGAAGQTMLALCRLTQAMADAAWLVDRDQHAFVLNRWTGWYLGAESFDGSRQPLQERLQRAAGTAAEAHDDALREELLQLEQAAPLARLAGRLNRQLGADLGALPVGIVSVMGQCTCPPSREAPLLEHREQLARLCRYALELRDARPRDRDGSSEPLARYVSSQARELLNTIDPTPTSLPTIMGFTGEDPAARSP